jgi:hypothetical protein
MGWKRRSIRRGIAVALATTACMVPTTIAPSAAHACFMPGNCPSVPTGVSASFTGWVKKPLDSNVCNRGGGCRGFTTGYRWTGATWVATTLPSGWVYVTPYASGWRWAYTAQAGWLAISTDVRLVHA